MAEMKKAVDWITVKGNHVPIQKGQTKKEAVSKFFEGKNELYMRKSNRLFESIEKYQARKESHYREGIKIISEKKFNDLTIWVKKKGAIILRGTKEVEQHLDKLNADAACVDNVIFFRKEVCISDVLEELYHFKQNLLDTNNDKNFKLREILNEIDAKKYLIRVAEKYKIPRSETEITKKQLDDYKTKLEKYLKEEKE